MFSNNNIICTVINLLSIGLCTETLTFKRCELGHFIRNSFKTIKVIFDKTACNDSDDKSLVVAYLNAFFSR